MSLHNISSAGR